MPAIGETLREARMRRRLDIADVEQRTKIRAKYLRAMENEEWSSLPGPTYVRTFLRTYAEVLGIDGGLLIEEYRSSHAHEEPDFAPLAGPPPSRGRDRRRGRRDPGPPRPGVLLLGIAVAVVAILLALGLSADDDDQNKDGGQASTQTSKSPAKPTKRAPRKRVRPVIARRVTLRIAPTEPTYACVDAGDGSEVVFEGTLDAARTFRNARHLRLNLGKRSVRVVANGHAVKVSESSAPYGLDVTRKRTREIVDGSRPCA